MEMRKCEVCGEMYSTTYRTCPFCEEEEAMRKGKPMHRHASDFRNKRGGNALGVLALVLALVVVGGGVWALFGDSIASLVGIRETSGTEGEAGDADGGSPQTLSLVLDQTTLTLQAGTTGSLSVTGGGENCTWSSDNTAVAEVNENGLITAVAAGEAVISVTDGTDTAQCTVQVTAGDTAGGETTGNETGGETAGGETVGGETTATLTLNREDFTLPVGEKWQLKVSGTSSAVTWSIEDTSIATIASDGTVTGVSKGVTTATAKVDGQTLECIVRIS